jgi:hypothetical protein
MPRRETINSKSGWPESHVQYETTALKAEMFHGQGNFLALRAFWSPIFQSANGETPAAYDICIR